MEHHFPSLQCLLRQGWCLLCLAAFSSSNLSSWFLNQSASTCGKYLKIHPQFTLPLMYNKATLCRKQQKALGGFVIKFSEHKKLG